MNEIPGLGGPFSNSADYYRAWAAKQIENSPSGELTSKFPSRLATAAHRVSNYPRGPFNLSHPDFGYHNFIVDDNYNLLAVIDWDGAQVRPLEFSAILPMSLAPLHPIFWEGGRFDTPDRREAEAVGAREQMKYLSWIKAQEREIGSIGAIWDYPQPLRIAIVDGMNKYEDGNRTPWEWVVDRLD